jgi:hypothetical protein
LLQDLGSQVEAKCRDEAHIRSLEESNDISDEDSDGETDDMIVKFAYMHAHGLPDVMLQLVKLNGNKEVFYTKAYENDIVQELKDHYAFDD